MNGFAAQTFLHQEECRMFGTAFPSETLARASLSDAAQALAAAIAYTVGMEDAHIEVVEHEGFFFLEGTAPSESVIERATEIAVSIVGSRVCNRIQPVSAEGSGNGSRSDASCNDRVRKIAAERIKGDQACQGYDHQADAEERRLK
jgi:hypothetical protein